MARAKLLLQEIETYAQNIGDTIRDPLLILDRELCVKSANRSFYKTFQSLPEETEGRHISKLGDGQWNIIPLLNLLRDIVPTKGHFDDYEVTHDFPKVGRRTMLLNARKLYRPGNRTVLIVLAIEDITERKQAAERLPYISATGGSRPPCSVPCCSCPLKMRFQAWKSRCSTRRRPRKIWWGATSGTSLPLITVRSPS
jgi:PAS domain S-box-containing protein